MAVKMLTFEEARQALTEIADKIPAEIYRELNGGVVLLAEEKLHPKRLADDLYIMGEYNKEPFGLGRYITIYYGSFVKVWRWISDEAFVKKLEEVLYHELTHHLESLAGDKSLEDKDWEDLNRYYIGHADMHEK